MSFASAAASAPTLDVCAAVGTLARLFDAVEKGVPSESCGSPGEVANQPELGHRYAMQLVSDEINDVSLGAASCPRYASCDDWGVTGASPLLARYDRANAKSMVHNTIALRAEDQLRQRVAWALAQVYVIGTDGLGKEGQVEVWTAYYDIFVRNAFGSSAVLKTATWPLC